MSRLKNRLATAFIRARRHLETAGKELRAGVEILHREGMSTNAGAAEDVLRVERLLGHCIDQVTEARARLAGAGPEIASPSAEHDDYHGGVGLEGEFVSISEHLAIAPARGRFYGEAIQPGATITAGAAMGRVCTSRREIEVRSHNSGAFVCWLAGSGEWVAPGQPLARLRSSVP
ncbi:MAG: hypothetical protein ACRDHM_04315 [Actinomycetota bacterium]